MTSVLQDQRLSPYHTPKLKGWQLSMMSKSASLFWIFTDSSSEHVLSPGICQCPPACFMNLATRFSDVSSNNAVMAPNSSTHLLEMVMEKDSYNLKGDKQL